MTEQIFDENITDRYCKMSPFNNVGGDFKYTACVGWNGGYNQDTICTGFREAAQILIKSISKYEGQSDPLVYPILFCGRHSIELFLKGLLGKINYIKLLKEAPTKYQKIRRLRIICKRLEWKGADSEDRNILHRRFLHLRDKLNAEEKEMFSRLNLNNVAYTHNLRELLSEILTCYTIDARIVEIMDETLPLLEYYVDFDPKGDAFRYWYGKDGKEHFLSKDIGVVRLDIVAVQFQKLYQLFDKIESVIWVISKEYETGTFTKILSRNQIELIAKELQDGDSLFKNIKDVKARIVEKYQISNSEFDRTLKIIQKHREFCVCLGREKKLGHLSDKTLSCFAKCAVNPEKWQQEGKVMSHDELALLVTFSDIQGWRYMEGDYAYWAEDLKRLYQYQRSRHLCIYDINPKVEISYVLLGMKKCGQLTYAGKLEKYLEQYSKSS